MAVVVRGDIGACSVAEAVAARPLGEPALAAFRRALLAGDGLLAQAETGDTQALDRLRTINQLITASPALLAREQQALGQATSVLAGVLAVDTRAAPGDLRPQVAAHALIGVQRALLDHVRRRSQSGGDLAGLATEVRTLAAGATGKTSPPGEPVERQAYPGIVDQQRYRR